MREDHIATAYILIPGMDQRRRGAIFRGGCIIIIGNRCSDLGRAVNDLLLCA